MAQFLATIFCTFSVIFSYLEGMQRINIPPLSQEAQICLDNPLIFRTYGCAEALLSLDLPNCIGALNSLFDGMTFADIERLYFATKNEMGCIMSALFATENDPNNILWHVFHRVGMTDDGNFLWDFLNRDNRILSMMSQIVGYKIPENLSLQAQIALFVRALHDIYMEAEDFFNLTPDEDQKIFTPMGRISLVEYKRQLLERLRKQFDDNGNPNNLSFFIRWLTMQN